MSNTSKKKHNEIRREFLLTFFREPDGYAERKVNNFWLIRYWDGKSGKWRVAIYDEESYKKYNNYRQGNLFNEPPQSPKSPR